MATAVKTDFETLPDERGHFGPYGGAFVAETLVAPLAELSAAYAHLREDPAFQRELDWTLKHFVGRPTPLYHAERWSQQLGGARVYLKREDLNHTGAHKVNNTVGQSLVAKYMGKQRVIAETGAGQHGVASATVAARLGGDERVGAAAEGGVEICGVDRDRVVVGVAARLVARHVEAAAAHIGLGVGVARLSLIAIARLGDHIGEGIDG